MSDDNSRVYYSIKYSFWLKFWQVLPTIIRYSWVNSVRQKMGYIILVTTLPLLPAMRWYIRAKIIRKKWVYNSIQFAFCLKVCQYILVIRWCIWVNSLWDTSCFNEINKVCILEKFVAISNIYEDVPEAAVSEEICVYHSKEFRFWLKLRLLIVVTKWYTRVWVYYSVHFTFCLNWWLLFLVVRWYSWVNSLPLYINQ